MPDQPFTQLELDLHPSEVSRLVLQVEAAVFHGVPAEDRRKLALVHLAALEASAVGFHASERRRAGA